VWISSRCYYLWVVGPIDVILLQNRNRAWWTQNISTSAHSMWLHRVKFIVKKSKCAGWAQEIGFDAPNSCRLPRLVKCATHECNKLNWTWVRLSSSDWLIIMIGPGGLLLVVPTYMQFHLQFYSWGCHKKQLNFDI
jgi:hypothetical protein